MKYSVCVTFVVFADFHWSNLTVINVFITFMSAKLEQLENPPLYADNGYDYSTLHTCTDIGSYARLLPPVPHNCPTALGMKGIVNINGRFAWLSELLQWHTIYGPKCLPYSNDGCKGSNPTRMLYYSCNMVRQLSVDWLGFPVTLAVSVFRKTDKDTL